MHTILQPETPTKMSQYSQEPQEERNKETMNKRKRLSPIPQDQELADPNFLYHPNKSTTCIFVPHPEFNSAYTIQWHHHDPAFFPDNTTLFSSSHGLVLCHKYDPYDDTTVYYVGNPFSDVPVPYKHYCPHLPHHFDTHAVIAAAPDNNRSFHIICLLPSNPTPEGNIKYTIDIYSSTFGTWFTLSRETAHLNNNVDRVIVPNSGVSCSLYGYWLTTSRSGVMMVVRVDAKFYINLKEFPIMTYLPIPVGGQGDVVTGVQLGRMGKEVGLVVVNETKCRVELYILNEIMGSTVTGEEDDDNLIMTGWTQFAGFLNVDVDPTMEAAAVEVVMPDRIRCREMPQPIRFESCKMEILLSVGGQRVVVWEGSEINFKTRLVVVDDEGVPANHAPFLASHGVPHVSGTLNV